MDDETRWLDPQQQHAWRQLVAVLHQLPTQLERQLQPEGLSFFDYLFLAMLSDSPRRSLGMSQLAELTSSSLSRLSHTASRLQARGWIRRDADPDDRRVTVASLTDEGLAKLEAVAPGHVESVRDLVFDVLSPGQVHDLGTTLGAVVHNIAPHLTAPWVPATPGGGDDPPSDAHKDHDEPTRNPE